MTTDAAWLKLAVLAKGVIVTDQFSNWFAKQPGVVRRRNFYNSPGLTDDVAVRPQEIRIVGDPSVVVAVNTYGPSPWELTLDEDDRPVITSRKHDVTYDVEPLTDISILEEDPELARQSNLYGGSALSFFTPRGCYFFADETECQFCSLAGTAQESQDFAARVTPEELYRHITTVVKKDPGLLNQIMIVGGNERDLDRGFERQVHLLQSGTEALVDAGVERDISVHLIVMPPDDHQLLNLLEGITNIHIGFNLEVWGSERFKVIAPGKHQDYSQQKIVDALYSAAKIVEPFRTHSILIAGLEDPAATLDGVRTLATNGVSAIVNVYHSDRHSRLGLSLRPTYRQLVEVASGLQELHDEFPIEPYWRGCGRNALDHEAANGMFRGEAPSFG